MHNRNRNQGHEQDYRDRSTRRDRQQEQFSSYGERQEGDGWRSQDQGGERWQFGGDFDRGQAYQREDYARGGSGYRGDTSALDDYDRAAASRFARSETRHGYVRGDDYGGQDYTGRGSSPRYGSGYGGRAYGASSYGANMYDRGQSVPPRQYDRDERGFFDRASDEVMSWFGDDDAARRREMDHQVDHRGRGPANYTRSSERLMEEACERLTRDPRVDASKITVSCSDNEITLDGAVDSRSAKRRAEDIVEDISGVKHVQNNLRVETGESYYAPQSGTSES